MCKLEGKAIILHCFNICLWEELVLGGEKCTLKPKILKKEVNGSNKCQIYL